MPLYDFLVSCDVHVTLGAMEPPSSSFNSPASAIKHEEMVSKQIADLFEIAHECKDYTTQTMLHWFLSEQVEEEELFRQVLAEVEVAGEERFNLILLDKEMAKVHAGDGGA